MPLRLPCLQRGLSFSALLHPYWGGGVLRYPGLDAYVVSGNQVARVRTAIDTGSDYVLLASWVAGSLRLPLPFPRQAGYSGAGGAQAGALSLPPDGLVSLFVTDYTEYCFLPRPPVAFHAPGAGPLSQRSVLGMTGFLQHFRLTLDYGAGPPCFELDPVPGFPGSVGNLPRDRPLMDFVRGLWARP